MNERILDLLYRSFDEELSKAEQSELKKALAASPELQKEKVRIAELRQAIAINAERSFRPFFAARVMQRLKTDAPKEEDFFASLVWAFQRIALVGAIAILLLIANNILINNNRSLDSILAIPQLSVADVWQLDNPMLEENL
ncbi:MAG: hypothetical protein ACE5HI_09850 [bacterium]